MRRVLAWALAAIAGIVVAVAISYAASTLSSQHVGLSSEPLTAGDRLVPHATRPAPRPRGTPTALPTRTPAATAPPAAAGDDGGGGDD